jgi:hypothetical protein
MGQIETINTEGATVYIGDYVANTMSDLEDVIGAITHRRPTEETTELLYLIGMVKLAAFDVQRITPIPDFSLDVSVMGVTELRTGSELDDSTVLSSFPWGWTYDPTDTEGWG